MRRRQTATATPWTWGRTRGSEGRRSKVSRSLSLKPLPPMAFARLPVRAAAATDDHPRTFQAVLPPRQPLGAGTNVLEEQQLTSRAQHPA